MAKNQNNSSIGQNPYVGNSGAPVKAPSIKNDGGGKVDVISTGKDMRAK